MKISVLQAQDIEYLPKIQPPTWYDLRPIHQFYIQAPFCYTFKAEVNGEMVGVGTVIIHDDVAWLAHILVHNNHQRKGIGKALSEYILHVALNKGIKTVYLKAAEMGAPVYSKIGFQDETEYLVYKDFKIDNHAIDPDVHVITKKDTKAILILDKQISGENRIDSLCLHFNTGFVYKEKNTVMGFYLPDFGEGLIIASDTQAGHALMKKRFNDKPTAIFPIENEDAKAFMRAFNLEPAYTIKRMWYGKKRPLNFAGIYNRIGGNLG